MGYPFEVWTLLMDSCMDMSVTQTTCLLFLVSVLMVVMIQRFIHNRHSPPGPWGFPVVGHLPLLGKKPYLTFMEMRKKYGDLICLQFGSWPTIVLNGKLIKEALCCHGDAFSGRPQFFSAVSIQNGQSLGFGKFDGAWKFHRRIANNAFLAFSNAKHNPLEDIIHEEVSRMLSEFEEYHGDAFDPREHIYIAVASVIYQMCYGRSESVRTDKDFCEYILHTKNFSSFVSAGNPIDIYPWLKYFMRKTVRQFEDLLEKGHLIRTKKIKEHLETFDADQFRDITDSLINTSKTLSEHDKANGMTVDRVTNTIGELFAAGFDTVATTTMWMIMLLAKHPRVQKKIQDELDEFVGLDRVPSLTDRKQLVYVEATLHEIMRIINLVPLSVPHSTTSDVKLKGFTIRKDTVVFVNLYSLSHDPEIWGDPDTFRPERFLTEKGEIDTLLVDKFLPFSTGRRRCFGESMARIELYLILTGFLQRVTFVKPKSVPDYTMDCHFGLNQKPFPYKVEVHNRT